MGGGVFRRGGSWLVRFAAALRSGHGGLRARFVALAFRRATWLAGAMGQRLYSDRADAVRRRVKHRRE